MTTDGQPYLHDKLDVLVDQVGRLTEGLIEIKLLIQQQAAVSQNQSEKIDRLANSVAQQSQSIDRQSQSIDRLASAMEATHRNQSEAVTQLVGIVNKLLKKLPNADKPFLGDRSQLLQILSSGN